MSKLLYVEASPRKERSSSIRIAREYLEAFRESHPDTEVETWDLWQFELPEFDGKTIDAKYRILHGESHSADEAEAWKQVVDVVERFRSADRYLFSLPMWNFGIPYKLKHLIDVLAQPGLTFSYSPETGYDGLIKGKPATVVYARGGAYSTGEAKEMDFQQPYFELFLKFIGFTQIENLVVEPTLADPETVSAMRDQLSQQARDLAKHT